MLAGPLTLGALELSNGSRIGTSLGGATVSQSAIVSTGAATAAGDITVDVYGIPGAAPFEGLNNLITADSGGLKPGGVTYTLGNVYNVTDFTVSGFSSSDTAVSITSAPATALSAEYWQGGFSGAAACGRFPTARRPATGPVLRTARPPRSLPVLRRSSTSRSVVPATRAR